jgi:hypothetical protein
MYKYEVGKVYRTQRGKLVRILGRCTKYKGYETLICSDRKHRYDRSTSDNIDAGRVTGTNHDYSYQHNFKRKTEYRGKYRKSMLHAFFWHMGVKFACKHPIYRRLGCRYIKVLYKQNKQHLGA